MPSSQAGEDPSLDDLYGDVDLGLSRAWAGHAGTITVP
jgi:hypothetical protein